MNEYLPCGWTQEKIENSLEFQRKNKMQKVLLEVKPVKMMVMPCSCKNKGGITL